MSGLPATSINWGMWADLGSATSRSLQARADLAGIGPIPKDDGIEALARIFEQAPLQIAVSPIDWFRFLQQFQAESVPSYYAHFRSEGERDGFGLARRSDILQRIEGLPEAQKRETIKTYLHEQVSAVMGFDPNQIIDDDKRLVELGMDSLMALEMKRRLEGDLRRPFPATMIFEYPTLEAISFYIIPPEGQGHLTKSKRESEENEAEAMEEIAKLSIEEAEQALISELESLADEDFLE